MAITHRKPPGRKQGHGTQSFVVLPGGRLADRAPTPRCPPGLGEAAKRRWHAFFEDSAVGQLVDLASDLPRLHRWIRASDEFDKVAKVIEDTGRLVRGSMDQPVLNPLYSLLRDLDAQLCRVESEFGMTPMARLRLGLSLGELQLQAQRLAAGDRQAAAADPDRRRAILEDDA